MTLPVTCEHTALQTIIPSAKMRQETIDSTPEHIIELVEI